MIIDLPPRFRFYPSRSDYAEIVDGVLHLYGNVSFRKLIYELTYAIHGNKQCYYCGKKMNKKEVTLDHMYPQDIGGPTITNNLVPCCGDCNVEKSNLSAAQYKTFLTLKKYQKEEYRNLINMQQNIVRRGGGYELPSEWISFENINKFIVRVEMNRKFKGKKYNQIKAYYKKFGTIQKPIVVDKNNFVLDGYITLMFAKNQGLKRVPVIKLENVEVHL